MFRKSAQAAPRAETQVEELFLQYYDRMLEWALHLTDHRAEQAEDLVHDAFVQLTMSPPDFAAIENLDGYLFVVLRNLYRSQMQRATRGPGGPASAVDYDSAEVGLKAVDPGNRLQAIGELRLVCRYACARKESSKAGGALILRFFHGYYPGEIAALTLISRAAVKELLRMARAEAKLFLDDPAKLGFIAEQTARNDVEIKTGPTIDGTIIGLRRAIFASRQGRCPERKHLGEIYDAGRPELLTAPLLGHIVSCQTCLEEVNRLLKLPPLSDRDPSDMLGPDRGERASGNDGAKTPPSFGSGSRARARQNALKKYRRRLREVYEHEPSELRIAVNGFVLAQQEVSASVNKQTLGIEVADDLALIEVLSEQGVRLLALHVEPPPVGPFERHARAELSEERVIEAHLSFCGSWPHLEIIYDCGTSDFGLNTTADSTSALFASFAKPQGLFARLKSAIIHKQGPQSAIKWLLRPASITVVMMLLLIAFVVGRQLGWRYTRSTREARSPKAATERRPAGAQSAEPGAGNVILAPTPAPATATEPSAAPVTGAAELEVEALSLLQQAGADLGEQVEVKRTAPGQLLIKGLVETDQRKAELLRALRSLASHPAVVIRIETVAEAVARRRTSGKREVNGAPSDESRIEVEKAAPPIAAELRAYLQARGGASEDEINNLAAQLHNHALRALDHLYALQRLSRQIGPAQCDALEPEARAKFLGLLAIHASVYAAKSRRLREELAAIMNAPAPPADATESIHNIAELYRAAAQLCEFGKSIHATLDQSLTISSRPAATSPTLAISSPAFWRALADAETLAARIAAYATQHQPTERKQ
jgi:DNA-directed RNA polymerase specialized sigma24 family protein